MQREARAAAALNHPNICTVHEIGEHEGKPFLAMELLEGQSLNRFIDGKSLMTDTFLEVAIQLADGLAKLTAPASGPHEAEAEE